MITNQQMILLRKIATRLRELKPYLGRVANEISESRNQLVQRHHHRTIDDEMVEAVVALDFAVASLDDTVSHIAEVTGEDESAAA